MKFRSDVGGYIKGIRFYKHSNNIGVHTASLWTTTGLRLATATFTNETASGWQEATLPVPVAIAKDTTYITSYHAVDGRFGFTGGYFSLSKDNPPLHAPASSLIGGNGVYKYGTSGFPNLSWMSANYWVDPVFNRTL